MLSSVHKYKAELATFIATASTYFFSHIEWIPTSAPTIGLITSYVLCKFSLSVHIKKQIANCEKKKDDYLKRVNEVVTIVDKIDASSSEKSAELMKSILGPVTKMLGNEANLIFDEEKRIKELVNTSEKLDDNILNKPK
ncbi:hypothetical protein RMN64_15715 [Plesiomonas shigelloides]|uniref:hypothetical protein n=1 Tax=Plesiomonas shigelloides TaxID=703 RepID=UPI0028843E3B|nr:hypothetical protein [Plesiomonas shigelloides]MDT1012863.1 hypothetical protein [Plesiomonas shigelloides]